MRNRLNFSKFLIFRKTHVWENGKISRNSRFLRLHILSKLLYIDHMRRTIRYRLWPTLCPTWHSHPKICQYLDPSPSWKIMVLRSWFIEYWIYSPYIAILSWNSFFRFKSNKIMNFRKLKECFVQFSSAVQWRPFWGSKGHLGSF